jgi:hypothetical protein
VQADTGSIEFGKGVHHVQHTPAKSIDGTDQQNVIATPHGILQHRVECGTLIPAL